MVTVNIQEKAISLLSATTVSLAAVAATTLYTVPTGKSLALFAGGFKPGADASTSTLTIGQVGALTDFLGTQTLSNLDASGDFVWLLPVPNATPVKCKVYAAGTVIQANVTSAVGGATNTLYLFGFLF